MTDRELLEKAAKAAGMKPGTWFDGWNDEGRETGAHWNPLLDDGDALRLAVKLRIVVQHAPRYVVAISPDLIAQHEDGMTDAATRRVIVRVAAECARLKTPNGSVEPGTTVRRCDSARTGG